MAPSPAGHIWGFRSEHRPVVRGYGTGTSCTQRAEGRSTFGPGAEQNASYARRELPEGLPPRLDLVLRRGRRCGLAGRRLLEELDPRLALLLVLLERGVRLVVLLLQLLEQLLVIRLHLADALLQGRQLGGAVLLAHLHHRIELRLLLGGAVLQSRGRAAGPERLGEFRELFQVTPALVVLALVVRRVEVLDRREALHAVLAAQRLACCRAVNVGDEDLVA